VVYKIDFINGETITWRLEKGEKIPEKQPGYRPHFYISGKRKDLRSLRPWIQDLRGVTATRFEKWKTSLSSKKKERVLRVDVSKEEKVMETVNRTKKKFPRSRYRFYNVGFTPQFRYCLQNDVNPKQEKLEKTELGLPRKKLADKDLSGLKVDGETFSSEEKALKALKQKISEQDPGILLVDRGEILPLIEEKFDEHGFRFSLGKMDELQQLAGGNTVSSYGKTVHANARYNVPGRIVIDRSNSFMLSETTMEGLWDLVDRSYKPLQELAWGSIGNLLTAIEVRKAYGEKTLTPWKNWEPEKPKKASTMHKADRGGFIFSPEPGLYEDVYEVDFASLYPNIMITRRISPETVDCSCCDNSEVPELDYSICEEREEAFISEVLRPLVEDRARYKQEVKNAEGQREKFLQGSIDAIKWILVSCFGYMGHAHASYGAIKCHQAINAYDRKIMLEAKNMLENSGYEIKHGIVDSLWVSEIEEDSKEIHEVCKEVSERVGIDLEFEYDFEWVAFLPRSNSEAEIGTLNRYFGKKKEGGFKTAGIETEQSSKPKFIQESQMQMIKAFDRRKEVEDVIEVLEEKIKELEQGEADPEKLVIEKTASKTLEAYSVENRTVAALKRYREKGIDVKPGQKVSYVVRDDEAKALDRVRLGFEASDYDTDFYRTELVRACESVLSPLGFDRDGIREKLGGKNASFLEA
jgi:DNA polymerase I